MPVRFVDEPDASDAKPVHQESTLTSTSVYEQLPAATEDITLEDIERARSGGGAPCSVSIQMSPMTGLCSPLPLELLGQPFYHTSSTHSTPSQQRPTDAAPPYTPSPSLPHQHSPLSFTLNIQPPHLVSSPPAARPAAANGGLLEHPLEETPIDLPLLSPLQAPLGVRFNSSTTPPMDADRETQADSDAGFHHASTDGMLGRRRSGGNDTDMSDGDQDVVSGRPGGTRIRNASRRERKRRGMEAVMRTWLRIDKTGEACVLQADKWQITHTLGIQARDLRLLDPNLSTANHSAILARDKAIVVNLEHIKAIITTSSVLIVNPDDERTQRFINDLKVRVAAPALALTPGAYAPSLQTIPVSAASAPMPTSLGQLSAPDKMKLGLQVTGLSSLAVDIPFELKALEACLDVVAQQLEHQALDLEQDAYPALDALAASASSPNLELVRRVKNALVRLTTRVDTMKEVLSKFLEDDSDMQALNLTACELREEAERQADLQEMEVHSVVSTRSSGRSRSTRSTDSSVEEAETAMVEMLLETYYMSLDNTLNKLQTLHEYIGDTEDLVNIQLDLHRNTLITINLCFTAFTVCIGVMTALSAYMAMNLSFSFAPTPSDEFGTDAVFLQVALGSSIGCIAIFVGFIGWLFHRNVIHLPGQ